MVAETRESMTRMTDCIADSFRTAFDAGRRTQEAFLKTMGEMWRPHAETDLTAGRGERVMREWAPFVGKSMETFAQTCDTTFRAGTDVFKTACDVATKGPESDPYESSRQVWDATFGAVRNNFDSFGKAGAKTMEHCTAFCDAILRPEGPRPATTPGKSAKVGG